MANLCSSGGCCDGSAPMCFQKGEFNLGDNDVKLGTVACCEFFMAKDQFERLKHSQLTLDVTEGRGSNFCLEILLGVRFINHSKRFAADVLEAVKHLIHADPPK